MARLENAYRVIRVLGADVYTNRAACAIYSNKPIDSALALRFTFPLHHMSHTTNLGLIQTNRTSSSSAE